MGKYYYLRNVSNPRYKGAWYRVWGNTKAQAVTIFWKAQNSGRRTLAKSDIAVRVTAPPRKDIYELTDDDAFRSSAISVARKTSPLVKSKLKRSKSLARKQHELLVKKSLQIKMPVNYVNDLLVHDKAILAEEKPDNFIWVVRPSGTDLIPLDNRGKLTVTGRQWYLGVLKYHEREFNGGSVRRVYHIKRTKIRETSFPFAMLAVDKLVND